MIPGHTFAPFTGVTGDTVDLAEKFQAAFDLARFCLEALVTVGWTCDEADLVARFLTCWGEIGAADEFMAAHAESDVVEEDRHVAVDHAPGWSFQ